MIRLRWFCTVSTLFPPVAAIQTHQERIIVQVPEICHERKTTHVSATWLFHSMFIQHHVDQPDTAYSASRDKDNLPSKRACPCQAQYVSSDHRGSCCCKGRYDRGIRALCSNRVCYLACRYCIHRKYTKDTLPAPVILRSAARLPHAQSAITQGTTTTTAATFFGQRTSPAKLEKRTIIRGHHIHHYERGEGAKRDVIKRHPHRRY